MSVVSPGPGDQLSEGLFGKARGGRSAGFGPNRGLQSHFPALLRTSLADAVQKRLPRRSAARRRPRHQQISQIQPVPRLMLEKRAPTSSSVTRRQSSPRYVRKTKKSFKSCAYAFTVFGDPSTALSTFRNGYTGDHHVHHGNQNGQTFLPDIEDAARKTGNKHRVCGPVL